MEVEPASLSQPSRSRLAEPGRDRDHGCARPVADDLELMPFTHSRLVNVAGEDEVCAGVDQGTEDAVAPRDRTLVRRPPRRAEQVVVEDGDAEGLRRRCAEPLGRPLELRSAQCAALVAERDDAVGSVVSQTRSNSAHGRMNRANV